MEINGILNKSKVTHALSGYRSRERKMWNQRAKDEPENPEPWLRLSAFQDTDQRKTRYLERAYRINQNQYWMHFLKCPRCGFITRRDFLAGPRCPKCETWEIVAPKKRGEIRLDEFARAYWKYKRLAFYRQIRRKANWLLFAWILAILAGSIAAGMRGAVMFGVPLGSLLTVYVFSDSSGLFE